MLYMLQCFERPSTPAAAVLEAHSTRRRRPAVSKYMLQGCDSLVFLWSFKAGVLLGAARGSGFIIRKVGGRRAGAHPHPAAAAAARGSMAAFLHHAVQEPEAV